MHAEKRYRGAYRLGHLLLTRAFAWFFRYQPPQVPPLPQPYMLVANHTFELDFTLVMRTFAPFTRFVIGETVFQSKLLRWLLKKLHDPVIIHKSGTDMRAVLDMLHRLRRGQNLCLFAEGDTTFDGLTGPVHPGTAMLVKGSGATLVTFRLRGGYFSRPRWGGTIRRGKTWGEVVGVYSPAQLSAMSQEQVAALLARDLHVDADQDQQPHPIRYRGRKLANGIESLLYMCAGCEGIGTLHGHGSRVHCQACGFETVYTQYGSLSGGPHTHLKDWARWQRERLAQKLHEEAFQLMDSGQRLRRIRDDHSLELVAQGDMRLGLEGLWVGDAHFALEDIRGMAIFRRNRLMFSTGDGTHYDIDPRRATSALKYRDAYRLLSKKE